MAFEKILIANRGEIACRIIATARQLGYRTVAVYSEADRRARHVALADQAVCIGPSLAAASYLNAEAILAAAARTGAGAIHPGYGFLSENDAFATACADAGVVFVGPPPQAIRLMGNKRQAKLLMQEAGVPCVPGYSGGDQDDARLVEEAAAVGFPLMVKAAAGGGGRGMRLVSEAGALPAAITGARSEAENAFGSGELILEKAVIEPRHIEIQIFADSHGNTIHFGERDCSIQRRHQKVVEEAPSPAVSPELRQRMGAAAIAAAEAVDYVGAGTVEFLLDTDGGFYFLEMNTRLQVEHPVTEEVYGEDLVEWQLRVADGEELPLSQTQVVAYGHAIEVRLYAEDPYRDFMPQTGPVLAWRPSDDIRVDHGILDGGEVTPYYDPMLAKLIAHGEDREEARRKLLRGLDETALFGVRHNADYLAQLLRHPAFIDGAATTGFIPRYFSDPQAPMADAASLALAATLFMETAAQGRDGWRNSGRSLSSIELICAEQKYPIALENLGQRRYQTVGDVPVQVTILAMENDCLEVEVDGLIERHGFYKQNDDLYLHYRGHSLHFRELTAAATAAAERPDDGRLLAPMAGRILAIHLASGDVVEKGDIVMLLEAMKMEHEIKAASPGKISAIQVTQGDQVDPRQELAVIEIAALDPVAEASEPKTKK